MSNQKLAIVIPAYKETYLRDTLESIANQTNKNFHLYIGDDFSPYDLESIVNDFRNRITITYHKFDTNLGGKDLVAQWERCINLTNDEPYIWLFSDDDTMDIDCVENFYKTLKKFPDYQLFHFNINMIDNLENGKISKLPTFSSKMTAGEFLEAKLRGKIVSYVVEFIFSRKLYEEVGGFQNFDLAWGSDFITWLKMAIYSGNGIYTISCGQDSVNWRRSRENISPNKTHPILIRKFQSLIRNASFINNQFKSNGNVFMPIRKSFRWVRFPLGEIYRNRKLLTNKDINKLYEKYLQEVGYPIHVLFSYIITRIF